ncbi:acyltransferase domain-containing protein [Nocardia pseudobrasiliensis]|uniref:[acyl-carrier-protein] S-malonyltransferase n=1 Tax=Nocardia pseudobrasiliensis TaxID=45979 RepID=A0A370IBF2_9NOCA|nr:acyltransferase domain-containing protein [Nocardia pseudobrasiliensis]RDI68048.1 malonyl CoA-acyl carrier protein transacylase [Nocardia pseudobrasiliensis]
MTVTRSAALFPGQGAYAGGALTAVRDRAEVREVLREIDEVAQRFSAGSVSAVLCAADAPGIDELLRTDPDLLQLAIYGTSVAAHRLALACGMRPDVLVGHSFGEVAALVCGGAYSVAAGAEIVCHRSAALRALGEIDGYQLALSADVAAVEQILLLIGDPRAVVAVENHAAQTVIAGPRGALDTAQAIAAALRIGATSLKSAYPFHSPILSEAAFDFAARIRHIPWQRPRVEVYSPILGRAYRDGDDLNVALAGHLARRVRFADALRALRIDTVVECGALDTLGRIARNVLGDAVRVAPLLEDSGLPQVVAGPTGSQRESVRLALAPGLAAEEFDRLWTACVERVAQLTISEFAAAVGPAVPDERPVLVATLEPEPTPAPIESPSRKELFQQLVVLYADALEYPPEVFDEDTDLEAELGVDSVKQTELLMRIGDAYELGPLPTDVKIGELNTLGRIADLIAAA